MATKCSGCGAEIVDLQAAFCSNCGANLKQENPPAAQVPTQGDGVLGVFESGGLSKGFGAGYRLVVRPSKVIGQKKYLGEYAWYAYRPDNLQDEKTRAKAQKSISEIEAQKQIEIKNDDVVSIQFKVPSTWKSGFIKFKTTTQGEIEIKSSSLAGSELLVYLAKSLQEFAPNKVQIIEK